MTIQKEFATVAAGIGLIGFGLLIPSIPMPLEDKLPIQSCAIAIIIIANIISFIGLCTTHKY